MQKCRCRRWSMVKLPAVGFIQATYIVLWISLRVIFCLSYLQAASNNRILVNYQRLFMPGYPSFCNLNLSCGLLSFLGKSATADFPKNPSLPLCICICMFVLISFIFGMFSDLNNFDKKSPIWTQTLAVEWRKLRLHWSLISFQNQILEMVIFFLLRSKYSYLKNNQFS